MIALAVTVALLMPSDDCYARYDDAWCAAHADQLVQAKPGLAEHLTTEEVGGYQVGDQVPIAGPRDAATIGPEDEPFLEAVEKHVKPGDRRWVIETAAGESELDQYAASPRSSAAGYMQTLARWYRHPTLGGSPWDPGWQAWIAAWLLEHGGRAHWAYQP